MKKLTIEYVKDKTLDISNGAYKCISETYEGTHTKLEFVCQSGHIFSTQWAHFQDGGRCPICGKIQAAKKLSLSIEEVEAYIKECGYTYLEGTYVNCKSKLKVKCPEGHIYKTTYSNFKSGRRCFICSNNLNTKARTNTIEKVKRLTSEITNGEYVCLSETYSRNRSKLEFVCPNNHKFKKSWANFFNKGQRCPICSKQSPSKLLLNIKDVKDYINSIGYACLSKNYVKASEYLKLKCPEGHIFYMRWNNFQMGYRCKKCSILRRTKYHTKIELKKYYSYKECVDGITNKNFKKYYYIINPQRLCRDYIHYHLDHIYSIIDGFENSVNPEIVASPINLQMLPAKVNMSKHGDSEISLERLLSLYNQFKKEWNVT